MEKGEAVALLDTVLSETIEKCYPTRDAEDGDVSGKALYQGPREPLQPKDKLKPLYDVNVSSCSEWSATANCHDPSNASFGSTNNKDYDI